MFCIIRGIYNLVNIVLHGYCCYLGVKSDSPAVNPLGRREFADQAKQLRLINNLVSVAGESDFHISPFAYNDLNNTSRCRESLCSFQKLFRKLSKLLGSVCDIERCSCFYINTYIY